MKLTQIALGLALTLVLIALVIYAVKDHKEGYLVNSGLSWYNRATHCIPPGGTDGTTPGFSGGCFTNSRVMF